MKHFVPLFALCIVVGAMIACSAADNTGTAANSSNTTSQSSFDDTPSNSQQHFKVSETVNVGKMWEVTVTNVRTSTGGRYDNLKDGNVYLIVDMSFKNISQEEAQLFGHADWTLKDTEGQKYDSAFSSDVPESPSGKVEPGGPAKGSLAWEVPASLKQFTLAFENNMWARGQTIWDITVS